MRNQNKLALFIFIFFVAICFSYVFFRSNELKKNGILINGKNLTDVFATKSSVMQFEYEFTYHGTYYKNNSPAGVTNSTAFIGKIFPVRFSPKTGKSEILITPNHFKRYKILYPDSLDWAKKYLIGTFK